MSSSQRQSHQSVSESGLGNNNNSNNNTNTNNNDSSSTASLPTQSYRPILPGGGGLSQSFLSSRASSRSSSANPLTSSCSVTSNSIGVISVEQNYLTQEHNGMPAMDTTEGIDTKCSKFAKDESISGKRFELLRVDLPAVWEYSVSFEDSCCAICRNLLKEPCIECQAMSVNGECDLEKAKCGHMFHGHCIMQWLQARSVCPLCNRPWAGQGARSFTIGNSGNASQQDLGALGLTGAARGLTMAHLGMGVQVANLPPGGPTGIQQLPMQQGQENQRNGLQPPNLPPRNPPN